MSPVAECDLSTYCLNYTPKTASEHELSSFFGCLSSALEYLHGIKIRHRDIKPQNVLVKNGAIYLTDFGISLDWENLTRSTTTKDTAKSLIYCAPEVARWEKRNSSSDIWSLGCVFLEMLTVLNGRSVQNLRQFFKSKTESQRFYDNTLHVRDWISDLSTTSLSVLEVGPWIQSMLQEDPNQRPTAHILFGVISAHRVDGIKFCGDCCAHEQHTSSEDESDTDPLAPTEN
jgi:serine/threonine protein kinase